MSLTLIALIGVLVGFLCLVIGFFMDDTKASTSIGTARDRRARTAKKKIIVARKKAA